MLHKTVIADFGNATTVTISEIEPVITVDETGDLPLIIFDKIRAVSRSWGSPFCRTNILINRTNFLAVVIYIGHKYGSSWNFRYYFAPEGSKLAKRFTWAQLSREVQGEVLDALAKTALRCSPGKLKPATAKPSGIMSKKLGEFILANDPTAIECGIIEMQNPITQEMEVKV